MENYDLASCEVNIRVVGSGILLVVSKRGHEFYRKLVTSEELYKAEVEYVKEIEENRSAVQSHEAVEGLVTDQEVQ